jgi:hypothetical protein
MVHLPALAALSTVAAALKFSDRLALSVYGFPDNAGFPAYCFLDCFLVQKFRAPRITYAQTSTSPTTP